MDNRTFFNGLLSMTGYETVTDYWRQIIEHENGLRRIKKYLEDEFEKLKSLDLTKEENYKKITEFVMMINWRSRYLDENNMQGDLENLYIEKREEYNDWCYDNLKGLAKQYYFRTTD